MDPVPTASDIPPTVPTAPSDTDVPSCPAASNINPDSPIRPTVPAPPLHANAPAPPLTVPIASASAPPLTMPLKDPNLLTADVFNANACPDPEMPAADSSSMLDELPEPDIKVTSDFPLKMKGGHEIRKYQKELAQPGINGENYMIVAPTGSGKTLVAAMVISDHLKKYQNSPCCHVVFVVNTKPLADQQKKELDELIPQARVDAYTGDTSNTVADSIRENNHISVCTAGKLLDEMRRNMVQFHQLSLMVFDECHHARKGHPYARLMECYLDYREKKEGKLPQIIGMTASPGAGDNPELNKKKTIDHLLNLAALMNATSGFKSVTRNLEELQESTKNSEISCKILQPREASGDPFILQVAEEMSWLEGFVPKVKNTFNRWSQEYETRIQQVKQQFEFSTDTGNRDAISTLKLLRCYSDALNVYMDLQQKDASQVMEKHVGLPTDDSQATDHERTMKQRMNILLRRLKQLSPRNNPLLEGMREILSNRFSNLPSSRGILFVRTKKHASAMRVWVSEHPTLHTLIKPDVITGHTSATGAGMTMVEQQEVMSRFHSGETNFLIATSVAEEGLDVPECNFVIRFQHVSNEIAKVQTEGRARAQNSQGFTILSSDSRKKYQELKNKELVMLMNEIFENDWFPTGVHLQPQIAKIQEDIVNQKKHKAVMKTKRTLSHKSEAVNLLCKKCKVFACCGSNIYTIGDEPNFHYVVPDPDFKEKLVVRPHPNPRPLITNTVNKTHKIYCSKCDLDWGSQCIWPSEGHVFPIIKCGSFIFEIEGEPRPVKKWSSAPFLIKPLSAWLKNHSDSEGGSD